MEYYIDSEERSVNGIRIGMSWDELQGLGAVKAGVISLRLGDIKLHFLGGSEIVNYIIILVNNHPTYLDGMLVNTPELLVDTGYLYMIAEDAYQLVHPLHTVELQYNSEHQLTHCSISDSIDDVPDFYRPFDSEEFRKIQAFFELMQIKR